MTNKLSDFQKQLFLDIYKTTLSALTAGTLANSRYGYIRPTEYMLYSAAKTALKSVELLTSEEGELCSPSEIINNFTELNHGNHDVHFPEVED